MADTADSIVPWPVRMITSNSILACCTRWSNSMPDMPGMFISKTATSKCCRSHSPKASAPLETAVTLCPLRCIQRVHVSRKSSSSSTINILIGVSCIPIPQDILALTAICFVFTRAVTHMCDYIARIESLSNCAQSVFENDPVSLGRQLVQTQIPFHPPLRDGQLFVSNRTRPNSFPAAANWRHRFGHCLCGVGLRFSVSGRVRLDQRDLDGGGHDLDCGIRGAKLGLVHLADLGGAGDSVWHLGRCLHLRWACAVYPRRRDRPFIGSPTNDT